MRDVGEWLAGLGLGRYARAFADHAVDARLLPTLTAQDLRDLGVASVGHRRKLLNAIAALERQDAHRKERRRLSVLFVDLVGSTALARQLDPEDMSAVIRRFQDCVAAEIERLEGHVAKFMGDGVLAYFGWPRAHEDEAERAVRAGLAIVAAVGRLPVLPASPLAVRVGIATGSVVVGETIGEGAAREETVVGDAPNLAARLQALAPPNAVLIGDSTRRLLGRLFQLEASGKLDAKGFDGGVRGWLVRGESAGQAGFEARSGGQAPLIGRDRELRWLLEQWDLATAGQGRAVLLLGEAGIGKSRLLRELCEAATAGGGGVVRWQASAFHSGTPLWPVARELAGDPEALAGLARNLRASGLEPAQGLALLGLGSAESGAAARLGGDAQRHRLLAGLLDRLADLAAAAPLLVVLEDAQWADPTTIDLVRRLLEPIERRPVLLAVSSRIDGRPPLPAGPRLAELVLGRLAEAEVAALAARLLPDTQSAGMIDAVVRRADGIPLFAEELAKDLAERGGEAVAASDVPASLHDTLMARLDRLPEVKEVAQIAACIGREIELPLLAAATRLPAGHVARLLDRLCEAGLLDCKGEPPAATWAFRHALVRDAAYESLLRSRRRSIHERILAALDAGLADRPVDPAETARHAAAAELWSRALHDYGVAGKAAIDRAAYAEAIDLLGRALDAGARQAGSTTAEVEMIDLRGTRCWAFLATGDTVRLMAELRAAESGAGRYGLARLSCQLRAQRAHVESLFGGHARRAIGFGREAGRIAGSLGDAELAAAARFVLAQALWVAGDYRAAAAELVGDLDAYRRGLRIARMASSGTLAVEGLALLGGCLGLLGRWDEALGFGAEAQALAADTGRPLDRMNADWHLARTLLARGTVDRAAGLLAEAVELAGHFGMRTMLLAHRALLGHARTAAGRPDEAVALLDAALAGADELRLQYTFAHAVLSKAEACLASGRADDGRRLAEEGLDLARAHGYRALEAAALRLLGQPMAAREIALQLGLLPELALIDAVSPGP
ncbi:MAG TPA: AAA family ATPase [Geminicoccaceae bacterium]|nr:AAA family ATPase [Geminicoccus sp.]HMU51606.1 AAA family ATPase [Geminicoccaceae bacterium]